MYVIVVGGGLTGFNIAKLLVEEGIGVVVIEKDLARCQEISKKIDALVIQGNGSNPKILIEAGARDADLLVAVTNSSEVNLISCITAKNLGTRKTVAKIAIEYTFTEDIDLTKVGVDYSLRCRENIRTSKCSCNSSFGRWKSYNGRVHGQKRI